MDDKTLQALTSLATKLQTTIEHLWGVLLRQALIEGVMGVTFSLAMLVVSLWLTLWAASQPKERNRTWDSTAYPPPPVIALLFGIVTAVMVGIILPDAIYALFNPEYWALKQIWK